MFLNRFSVCEVVAAAEIRDFGFFLFLCSALLLLCSYIPVDLYSLVTILLNILYISYFQYVHLTRFYFSLFCSILVFFAFFFLF